MIIEKHSDSSIFLSFATARRVQKPATRASRQGLFILTQISSSTVHILTWRCLTMESSTERPCSLCRPYFWFDEIDDDDDENDDDDDDYYVYVEDVDVDVYVELMMLSMMLMLRMLLMMMSLMNHLHAKSQWSNHIVFVGKAILPEVHCANGHCLRSSWVWLSASNLWLGSYLHSKSGKSFWGAIFSW